MSGMKKIKILRIISRLNIGGPAINAVLLTEGFNNQEFESILVAGSISKNEGDMSYLARDKKLNLVFIPQLGRKVNPLDDLVAFFKIYGLIVKYRPDIVHSHTAKAGTLGRLSAIAFNLTHKKKIKIVHTFHGHVLSGYFNKFLNTAFIFIEKVLAKFTDIIIVVSEAV